MIGRKPTHPHLGTFHIIQAAIQKNRQAPTLAELFQATGLTESTICAHIRLLEAEGYIRRRLYQKRGIELTGKLPEAAPVIESKPKRKAPRLNEKPLPRLTKAQLDKRVDALVQRLLSNPQAAYSEDAKMKVLPNGIKVIIRTPSLWGSKAHQAG